MPRRVPFATGEYYHVYNRGAGRRPIFFSDGNYRYLIELMQRTGLKTHVTVIAYCLMPNHYHFLVRQDGDQPVSSFVNLLFNAYVQALNRQQAHTGTLFEGRFRCRVVRQTSYVLALCRYIHLNPVRAGLVSRPEDWPNSDYCEWISARSVRFGDGRFIHQWFAGSDDYVNFVSKGLAEQEPDAHVRPYVWD